MTSTPRAKISNIATDYDISPYFHTVDHSGEPVDVTTVVIRRYTEGDDGQPYTAVDVSGYRCYKNGKRKSHGTLYLGLGADEALLAMLGIEV
jgi:hypothetical protein